MAEEFLYCANVRSFCNPGDEQSVQNLAGPGPDQDKDTKDTKDTKDPSQRGR